MNETEVVEIEFAYTAAEIQAMQRRGRTLLFTWGLAAIVFAALSAYVLSRGHTLLAVLCGSISAYLTWQLVRMSVISKRQKGQWNAALRGMKSRAAYREVLPAIGVQRYRFDRDGMRIQGVWETVAPWEMVESVNLSSEPVTVVFQRPEHLAATSIPRRAFDDATFARFTSMVERVRPRFVPSSGKRTPPSRREMRRNLAVWIGIILALTFAYSYFAGDAPRTSHRWNAR